MIRSTRNVLSATVYCAIITLLSGCSSAGPVPANREHPMLLGMQSGNAVFAAVVDPKQYDRPTLYRRSADGSVTSYSLPLSVRSGGELRWRVARGYIWSISYAYSEPIGPFMTIFRIPVSAIDRWRSDRARNGSPEELSLIASYMFGFPSAITRAMSRSRTQDSGPVHYDLVPLTSSTCLLFVLEGSTMAVWDYSAAATGPGGGHRPESAKSASFDVGFKEPFYAFVRDGDYYFVTESGKAFHSRQGSDGEWITQPIWSDKDGVIDALLLDADSGKASACGKSFWFELDSSSVRHDCAAVKASKLAGTGEPLRTVARCALARE